MELLRVRVDSEELPDSAGRPEDAFATGKLATRGATCPRLLTSLTQHPSDTTTTSSTCLGRWGPGEAMSKALDLDELLGEWKGSKH